MELNLTKPIIFFDLETTGVQVGHDHIVEICLHKVMPDGTTDTRVERVRPADAEGKTIHIPEVTTAVHGITDADVADKPTFRELAPSLLEYIGDADLAGYNSNKCRCWWRSSSALEWTSTSNAVDSSMCRTSSTRWNSAPLWLPISSTARKTSRMPIPLPPTP